MSGDLVINSSIRIPRAELMVSVSTSGGPGGQHANRAKTRVELIFDVGASGALTAAQRDRIIEGWGPVIRVVVDDERSQLRNRAIADERLAERIRQALAPQRTRRATRPTRASQRRRRQAKTHRSTIKRQRRRPTLDD